MLQHELINSDGWTMEFAEEERRYIDDFDLEVDLLSQLTQKAADQAVSSVLQRSKFPGKDEKKELIARAKIQSDDYRHSLWDAIGKKREIIQIAAAVQRQSSFIRKMERHLWVRSPALEFTLVGARDRYAKFLELFKLFPKTTMVPTLDIDLVWHTHQCSAQLYELDTITLTGRFINHDDSLETPILDNGMENTQKLFEQEFGQEYRRCLCWECQAVSSSRAGFNRNSVSQRSLERQAKREVVYYKTLEAARRAGKPLPSRRSSLASFFTRG
jgi:hypothetical protein